MRVLLLSAYDAASHRHWRELLVRGLDDWQWTCLTLPPRYFNWRVRGNPLSWALGPARSQLERPYDLLVATSMVDLATLRGLVPALAATPALLYFHENQFAYPASGASTQRLEPQMVSLYSALSAQRLAFNSRYNRDTFIAGVSELLRRFPDQVPPAVAASVEQRAELLPVPLTETGPGKAPRMVGDRLNVVWNHRWEYDKGPRQLLAAVRRMQAERLPVTLHVIGQQFRRAPEEFTELRRLLASDSAVCAGEWGYIENPHRYRQLLLQADVVLSTALHDFQGLAVQEAVAAGCVPLVPDRLCYPEYFAAPYRYRSAPDAAQSEAADLVQRLRQWQQHGLPAVPDLSGLCWRELAPVYRRLLRGIAMH